MLVCPECAHEWAKDLMAGNDVNRSCHQGCQLQHLERLAMTRHGHQGFEGQWHIAGGQGWDEGETYLLLWKATMISTENSRNRCDELKSAVSSNRSNS